MTSDARLLLVTVIVTGLFAVALAVIARRASKPFPRRVARFGAVFSFAVFAVFAWGRLVEPRWIEVTRTRVAWSGPPLRIAVLADFHAGRVGGEVIADAVRLANQADPDVVLIAGDFISGWELDADKAAKLASLRLLHARNGVFAVLGNHDSEPYTSPTPRAEAITRMLGGMGIGVLRNRWIELSPGAILVGLDEVQSGHTDAARAFAGAPDGGRVVLTHDWHALRAPNLGRFDLAVTGHTHGGQICLPFTGFCPFAANNVPYLAGLYDWPAGGRLFVTRGVGESAVLMRMGCRPEVAIVEMGP